MFEKSTWIEVRTCVHAYETIVRLSSDRTG